MACFNSAGKRKGFDHMALSEVLKRPAVPIAETDWGGGGGKNNAVQVGSCCGCSDKT